MDKINYPLVSVLMTAYNREKHISVLTEKYCHPLAPV